MNSKKVVITSGDPAGCGPLITLKAIEKYRGPAADFFVVGDAEVFRKISLYRKVKSRFNFIDLAISGITNIKSGCPSQLTGYAALAYLDKGIEIIKKTGAKRLVTAPLSKEAVKLVLPEFCGHTEYLAAHFGVSDFAMLMFSPKLKTLLFTRHIPLREVASCIEKKALLRALSLLYSFLRGKLGIKSPKIAFVALNPHAGVDTYLDKEEQVIIEAISRFDKPVYGPYPADTLFLKNNLSRYDCLISLYHDQAMVPFKLLSIKEGVNITLGLPILRTSPAHGLAADIIRQKKTPFSTSMLQAIKTVIKLNSD